MKYILTYILLLISSTFFAQSANYIELKKIYLSTNGDNWIDNSGWKAGMNNPNSDPCSGPWKGILCASGVIISIELSNNNLSGTLPSEIKLPNLKFFKAAGNKLVGEIPLFGNLLQQIDLRKNKLTGEIPSYLVKYKDVQTGSFAFSDNDLSGCYPSFISQFAPGKFGTLNNPKLPFKGDHTKIFSQGQPQIGAPCDDGISNGSDFINADCTCHDAAPCEDVIANRTYSVCFGMKYKFYDTFYSAGIYNNIRITNSSNCDTLFNLTIKNHPDIIFDLGPDQLVCKNTPVQIGISPLPPAQGITYTYKWSNLASDPIQTVSQSMTTDYTLTVTNNYSCSKSDLIKVAVLGKIDFPINVTVCKGEQYTYKGELLSVGTYDRSSNNQVGCDTLFKITVAEKPEIIVLDELSIKCDVNQNIKLSDRLELEPNDGTWKEVSAIMSLGGFIAAAGTFNPYEQKPGIYTFSYEMKAGTYCGPSSRMVNIRVTLCDVTIACKISPQPDSVKIIIGSKKLNVLSNDEITVSDLELKILNYDNSILSNVSINNLGDLAFTISDTLLQPTSITYASTSIECSINKEGSLKILVANSVDINVTNIITPNNDGFNDVLKFNNEPVIKGSELWIYNRWGSRIYHVKDYKNDWSGEGYPGGTYYYVLKINDATYKSALTVDK